MPSLLTSWRLRCEHYLVFITPWVCIKTFRYLVSTFRVDSSPNSRGNISNVCVTYRYLILTVRCTVWLLFEHMRFRFFAKIIKKSCFFYFSVKLEIFRLFSSFRFHSMFSCFVINDFSLMCTYAHTYVRYNRVLYAPI